MQKQDLMIKTSWLYHVEGLTQAQIGERMNLTRRRVNELLAMARDEGIVRISFTAGLADNAALEARLCEKFGLEDAVVVPTPGDKGLMHQVLGRGAAAYLDRMIEARQPKAIGVGWGATLRETVRQMTNRSGSEIEVRSMMGGLTRGSEINTFDIVHSFAAVLNGRCHYFAAPIYAGSSQSRATIIAQPVFQEVLRATCEVDLSYLSIGDVSLESLQVKYGLPPGTDIGELAAAGAVGDLLGRYLDRDGRPVDHPLNSQVVSPELENYRNIPCRIVASGGAHKHAILSGTVRAGLATIVITDSDSAKFLLGD